MFTKKSQPFYTIGRRVNFISMAGKDSLEEITVHTIIINDQKLDHIPDTGPSPDVEQLLTHERIMSSLRLEANDGIRAALQRRADKGINKWLRAEILKIFRRLTDPDQPHR